METSVKNQLLSILLRTSFKKDDAEFVTALLDDIGRKQETFFMHYKDFFLNKNDKIELVEKINSARNEVNQTIYVVGLVQFLAIVGSVLAIPSFS